MELAPEVRKRGCGPTGIFATAWLVFGSTFVRRPAPGVVTQIASSAKRQAAEFGGMEISCSTRLTAGLMRASTPLGSLTIQTLPAPVVTPPSLSAGPTGMVATT